MSQSSSSSGGIGFCGMLTILFIGLKLGGLIDWSWIWVLSPMWIPLVVALAIFTIFGIGFLAVLACTAIAGRISR